MKHHQESIRTGLPNFLNVRQGGILSLIAAVSMSAAFIVLFNVVYFRIFPWVLSFNIVFSPGTLTPWIEQWTVERDGIEIYVLYDALILGAASITLAMGVIGLLNEKWKKLALAVLIVISITFVTIKFRGIVFTSPSDVEISFRRAMVYGLLAIGVALLLIYFQRRISHRIELLVACMALIPFCFIATGPIAASNYAYIYMPAQKMLEGVPVSNIYFQYDLLLSLLAAMWMKLNLNLSLFQILGQAANFVAIISIFLVARSLFHSRALSLLLLLALVLVRILSAPWDPVYVFQITPLRLDLWLVPFLIMYWDGPKHWLVPFSCGILILVHGAFGLVYTLAYVQIMITLGVLSILDVGYRQKFTEWRRASAILRVTFICAYFLACYLLAKTIFGQNIEATSMYQKIGIGFIPISQYSLFWIFPVITSIAFFALCSLRTVVERRYIVVGLALIYFSFGNCIYFFGRSHELNLFSISISMLFVLFYFIDIIVRYYVASSGPAWKWAGFASLGIGVALLGLATYSCAERIGSNLAAKMQNALAFQWHPGDPFAGEQVQVDQILAEVHGLLGQSPRVQFMIVDETREFLLYQVVHGNSSYFYPLAALLFNDQLVAQAQSIIDDGGYIMMDDKVRGVLDTRISGVDYRVIMENGPYTLIGRKPPSVSRVGS